MKRLSLIVSCQAAFLACGCSNSPSRVQPPDIDAAAAARAAIKQLDSDSDGRLTDQELAAAPGLLDAKSRYDANGDGTLDETETAAGIKRWSTGKVGAIPVQFVVTLDGRPLADAQVALTPEPFLGEGAKGAITETRRGVSYLTLAPDDRPAGMPNIPLIQPGLYQVSITSSSVKLPPRYNQQTQLGKEITRETVGTSGIVWPLKSK